MIFAGLVAFVPALWFLPWWSVIFIAAGFGYVTRKGGFSLATACGITWAALAFIKDGRSAGLISARVSGMFQLPYPALIFVLVFTVGFVTALLCFYVGRLAARHSAVPG